MKQKSCKKNYEKINFIGKKDLINVIKIHIKIALKTQNNLNHCLLYGKPGLGKTTFAKLIASKMKVKIKNVQGLELQSKADILNVLINLNDRDILFIDEIHTMNKQCYELFYSIKEEHKINIIIGKENNMKITKIDVPKISIIGATTDIGNLPNPFENRFPILLFFTSYLSNELEDIIESYLIQKKLDTLFSMEEIKKIALYSRGTPRIAKNLTMRIIDFKLSDYKNIELIFEKIGVFPLGLKLIEVNYLKLFNKRILSLSYISQMIQMNEKTIETKIEPYLFELDLIIKTSKGRKLTEKGLKYFDLFLK